MPKLNKSKILGFLLFISCFFSYTWINSYFISSRNVDYSKYYGYINYFTGIDVEIEYGQGVIYYFLIARRVLSKIDSVNFSSSEFVLNSAVHEINFLLFLIGLIGFFAFLKFKNYKTETILASLIFLVYFPQTIYLRAVMKPEILAFAFIPWVLLCIEKYILDHKIQNLLLAIPFLSLIINSKGSVAGMIIIYLIISYFQILKKITLKKFIIILISSLAVLGVLQFENYTITGNTLFERPFDPEYDFKADPTILINADLYDAIRFPFFKLNDVGITYHSDSVANPILLDTFGDYFNQLFDSDDHYFSKNRKDLFVKNIENSLSESRQISYDGLLSDILIWRLDHVRKIVSLIFSIIFYSSIIFIGIKDKKNRKFFFAPFIGIIILYINSLGFPSNNFNPIKGDTFKSFYFSFLLSIAILFVGTKIFKKINYKTFLFLALYVLSILFISGHPKQNDQLFSEYLVVANQYSPFCEINNYLIFENDLLQFLFNSGNINNLKSDCDKKKLGVNPNRASYDSSYAVDCIGSKKEVLNYHGENRSLIPNSSQCRIYALEQVKDKNSLIVPRVPFFSISLLFYCIFYIMYEVKFLIQKKRD